VGLSSCYCGSKVRSLGQWASGNCAALPTANAGQNRIIMCCTEDSSVFTFFLTATTRHCLILLRVPAVALCACTTQILSNDDNGDEYVT